MVYHVKIVFYCFLAKCCELFCKPGSILTFAMELKRFLVAKVSYMLDFVAIKFVFFSYSCLFNKLAVRLTIYCL